MTTQKKTTKTAKAEENEKKAQNIQNDIENKTLEQTENIVLAMAKAGLFDMINDTIKKAGLSAEDLLLQEYKEEKQNKLNEIDNLIAQTALPEVKALLQAEKEKIENEGNVPLLVSSENWQKQVDNMFMILQERKDTKVFMLIKNEKEAKANGTAAINYLFRQYLLEKRQSFTINQMLDEATKLLSKFYRSTGHIKQIVDCINYTGIAKAQIRKSGIHIQYS